MGLKKIVCDKTNYIVSTFDWFQLNLLPSNERYLNLLISMAEKSLYGADVYKIPKSGIIEDKKLS